MSPSTITSSLDGLCIMLQTVCHGRCHGQHATILGTPSTVSRNAKTPRKWNFLVTKPDHRQRNISSRNTSLLWNPNLFYPFMKISACQHFILFSLVVQCFKCKIAMESMILALQHSSSQFAYSLFTACFIFLYSKA